MVDCYVCIAAMFGTGIAIYLQMYACNGSQSTPPISVIKLIAMANIAIGNDRQPHVNYVSG